MKASLRIRNVLLLIGLMCQPLLRAQPARAAALPADMVSPTADGGQCLTVKSTDPTGAPGMILDTCRGTPQQMWTHDSVSGKWQTGLDANYCLAADALSSTYALILRPCADSRALTLEPNPTEAGSWRVAGTSYVVDFSSYANSSGAVPVVTAQHGWPGEIVSWLQADLDVVNAQGCAISYPFAASDTATYNRELACDHVAKIQPPYATPANAARDPKVWPGAVASDATPVTRSFAFNLQFKDNSYMRMRTAPMNWMSTGLYAPAGQIVTINLSGATEAELARVYVQLGVQTDILTPASSNVAGGTFQRYPNVTLKIRLHAGDNQVRIPYGGVIELVSEASVNKVLNVTIANAVETPHYVLGTTSESDWNASRNAPGAWAVIENDLGALFVRSSDVRAYSYAEITTLAQFYRDFAQNENNLVGVSASDPSPAQQPPQGQQRYADDIQPGHGYGHSGYPTIYDSRVMLASLTDKDNWALFHELGHNQQQLPAWGDTYGTETTVNLFSLYNQELFFSSSRIVDEGRYTQAIANLNDATITDKWNYGGAGDQPFWRLVFLDQIRLAFPNLNWNMWTQLMRRYRDLSTADYNAINTDQRKYDTFMKYLCDITNANLGPHFTAWTIPVSSDALSYCSAKPALERQIWQINAEKPMWYHPGGGSGGFLREWWNGINGANISDLTGNAAYPAAPSGQEILTTGLEGRRNFGDNYGERLRAYLVPPVSGAYRFWLSSDDVAQLSLSTDEDPAHATSILSAAATGYRTFDADTFNTQYWSEPVQLEAGHKYYIEVLHKESTGYDSVSVAWSIPAAQGLPGEVRKIIDAQYLSPYTADLALAKTLAAGQAASIHPGDDATFHVQVSNNGGATVKNVQVMDALPAGFTLSPADTHGWIKGYRYVRFEADSSVSGSNDTSTIAELGLLDGSGNPLSRSGWTVESNVASSSGNPPANMLDGNSATIWESQWWPSIAGFPHIITIDTGAPRTLSGFTYLARQNSYNGRVGNYKFSVSEDGTNWVQVASGTLPDSTALQTVTFTPPPPARAFNTLAGPIAPGASASVDITLRAGATLADGSYTNAATLTGAQDAGGSRAFDANAANDSGTATLQVSNNHAPGATNDAYSTSEDTPLTVNAPGVLGNDTDAESNPLMAQKVSDPAHGTLAFNADGSFTYTPAPNYNGSDSFTYKANDGTADSNVATVNLTINAVNDAPSAGNDAYSTSEDTPLSVSAPGVLANDTDVDSSALTAALVDGPAHGTLTFNADGSFSYTPAPNYNGTDSFTYKANDGAADSAVATVNLTISPMNDAPAATNDGYSTNEDTPLSIAAPGVLSNDTDVDGNALTALKLSDPSHGTLTFNADGSFSYTPEANYHGDDSFTYQASDGAANSNVATVALTVNAVNDAPVAHDDSYTTDRDQRLSVAAPGVLANDTDVDGDALTAVKVSDPVHGTLTFNADGSFDYTPAAGYSGSDSFSYKTSDGTAESSAVTVNLGVNATNYLPVVADDAYTTNEDTPLSITTPGVLSNDTDADHDGLTAQKLSDPVHGTLTFNADGSFTYTPEANWSGSDHFTYQASDGKGTSNVATVNLTVNAVNDAPAAVNDSYSTNEDVALSIPAKGVLANDTDAEGDALTALLVSSPAHGTLALNSDGSFVYTPAANWNGTDIFSYKANDGTTDSAVAAVSIQVSAVNDAPSAVNDSYSTNQDTALNVPAAGVLGNDTDVESNALTAVLVTGPAHGTLALNANGSFAYTPAAGWSGSDSFTYKANDGAADSNVATVTLNVVATNHAPVAVNDSYNTNQNTALTVAAPGVLSNDTDQDGNPLSAVKLTNPAHGVLTFNANGSFVYTPATGWSGTDSFTYRANDGTANSNAATVSITVKVVNLAPVANNQSVTVAEDASKAITLTGSDPEGAKLTYSIVSAPAHGTLSGTAPKLTYKPAANYNGVDSFTFKVNDGQSDSAPGTITINVTAVNDAPLAASDRYTTDQSTALTIAAPGVLSNDTDVDNDALTAALVSAPTHGTLTLNANGSFVYTPVTGYSGSDSFKYQAKDGVTSSTAATVAITVRFVPHPALSLTKSASPAIYSYPGQAIVYTYVIKNTGDVTLSGPFVMNDDKLGAFTCTTASSLAMNATATCTKSYTVQAADVNATFNATITNHAFASGKYAGSGIISNQAQSTVSQVPPTAQVSTSSATCSQFAAGTSADLTNEYYQVKLGKLSSVTPGVFAYYTKVTAPSSSFQVGVQQTNDSSWTAIDVQDLNVDVYNSRCAPVSFAAVIVSGKVTFSIRGATAGTTYYIGIKYQPNSLVGRKLISPYPSVAYRFVTSVNSSDVISSWDSVNVKPQ